MANQAPLGVGVVGAGSIGIRFALEHLSLPDIQNRCRLAAVCDPAPGRAQAAAAKYGAPNGYATLEELLTDPAVDVITLCSPIGIHYDQALKAIEAGKHIHFNKTMTVTSAEALDLIAKAKEAGVKLVASPGQMTRSVNRRIREIVQSGGIGRIAWAVTGASFGDYHERESVRNGEGGIGTINPSWYWRKPGGGPLYDMTVYGLHTLTGILGPVKRVTAMSANQVKEREFQGVMYPSDAEDSTIMVLDFGDGKFAMAHGTLAGMVSDFGQPTIFGTSGSIVGTKLNGEPVKGDEGVHFFGPHVVGRHAELEEMHVYEDFMQLVDYVLDGTPPIATAEHAAHVIEIIEMALKAAETGQTQRLGTTFAPV